MNDRQFEYFVGRILTELGYENVEVVGRSGDGGVDVRCELRGPLIEPPVTVVCQVKRHSSDVGGRVVGELRGRWEYRADRLILVNLSGFTPGAREEARDPRANKQVSLISGEDLVNMMTEKSIGITKEPVVRTTIDGTFFESFV